MPEDAQSRFVTAFDDHARAVLAFALRRVPEPEDAADVVAETYLVAWRRVRDLPPGDEARPWLYGVARRVLANQRRGSRRRSLLGEKLRAELAAVQPIETLPDSDQHLALRDALARLNDQDRELLRLTSWEMLTPAEIAVVLSIPAATVRTRLHRARNRLRAELGDGGETSTDSRTYRSEKAALAGGYEEDV